MSLHLCLVAVSIKAIIFSFCFHSFPFHKCQLILRWDRFDEFCSSTFHWIFVPIKLPLMMRKDVATLRTIGLLFISASGHTDSFTVKVRWDNWFNHFIGLSPPQSALVNTEMYIFLFPLQIEAPRRSRRAIWGGYGLLVKKKASHSKAC